jgi:acyl-CoA thioester hydrolase
VGAVFTHCLRVRFGECDPQGVVFNANYFLYFDVAITEFQRQALIPYDEMVASGTDMVVAEARGGFRRAGGF